MNRLQLMMVMHDLKMNISHGMRLTDPNKGLTRLKKEYKTMLGLPKNCANLLLFDSLLECAILPNAEHFQEDFVKHMTDFLEEQYKVKTKGNV